MTPSEIRPPPSQIPQRWVVLRKVRDLRRSRLRDFRNGDGLGHAICQFVRHDTSDELGGVLCVSHKLHEEDRICLRLLESL